MNPNTTRRKIYAFALSLVISICLPFIAQSSIAAANGINLPPTQGTTNAGAFLPGVYKYNYSRSYLRKLKRDWGFTHIRVPINAATALDRNGLNKAAWLFSVMGNKGVICFFDTRRSNEPNTHGNGKPNGIANTAKAWKAIHKKFKNRSNIRYEIFNEPFGYPNDAVQYVKDMKNIIRRAGLPKHRVILDGSGYAGNVDAVRNAGWDGDLAYHAYPNWLPAGSRTQENFSNLIQDALAKTSNRVHVTEFGAVLTKGNVYNTYSPDGNEADRNFLRGMHDALSALNQRGKGVKASYLWHGWNNGDTYSVSNSRAYHGREKIRAIQRDD